MQNPKVLVLEICFLKMKGIGIYASEYIRQITSLMDKELEIIDGGTLGLN